VARFGFKKQGRMWSLFQGSEMVSHAASGVGGDAGGSAEGSDRLLDPALAEQQPAYDNETEYSNFKTALEEAKHHPALELAEKQTEREKLQREIETLSAVFEAKHRRGKAIAWDAGAEEELHTQMRSLNELLKLVGLSLHHL
jgi:hypothetical protein